MTDHIILCGLGKIGISVLELLHDLRESVVAITLAVQPEWEGRARTLAHKLIIGDARDDGILAQADIRRARAIVIATDDDLANLEVALDARRMSPAIAVVVRIHDLQIAEGLQRDLRPRAVLNAVALSAPAFVAAALGDEVIRAFEVGDASVKIVKLEVTGEASGAGQTLAAVAERAGAVPLALRTCDRRHGLEPSPLDAVMSPGDEAVLAVPGGMLAAVASRRPRRRWYLAGMRRAWRRPAVGPVEFVRRVWHLASPAVRYTFLAAQALGWISIAVFHYGLRISWLDALYFTATIMSAVGFGDLHLLTAPPAVKLFGCLLMVSGVALTAILFSLITNYLISQRFEQALGRKRTTLSDHIVVVGLGHVGYGVARRLYRLGHRVLAIEKDPGGPFVNRLPDDLPVLVGDADQPQMMEQAGVERARAIVAVTDSDLANLRLAQHARALNPRVRTVVRLFNSSLAAKLGPQVLGVDQPLNPSQAAAATFAACALASDVVQGFTLGSRLFMLRWLDDTAVCELAGSTIAQVRDRGDMTVVLRQGAEAQALQMVAPTDVVQAGDRLVVLEEYRPAEHETRSAELLLVSEPLTGL